ncbi:MAG: 30S ribosomal protein S17e [Candidatus Methanoliparum thermophilum]|uniref:Small ribosomal subunit protein eS17 n=1 Tax=Methanoliparum thermophilum TaxID=2491083 RepID=A0A520KU22_METT2|nr:30S ribosomal protein S17e [Candidatus Methanoliparum sp. LAM-1]RZN65416.1 MAG: 30S ribosomal protein S17e [Candidatus Methanoliparum thermophilum]BDC35495.1 30S ribosomal protein S17e [Candidatus Methanoliparum sp. LAM-1]
MTVKTTMIKTLAEDLLERYNKEFTLDFENNKKKVEEFTDITSKKIRNMIAGRITRILRVRSKKAPLIRSEFNEV